MKSVVAALAGAILAVLPAFAVQAREPVSWSDMADPSEVIRPTGSIAPAPSARPHPASRRASSTRGAHAGRAPAVPSHASGSIHALVSRIAAREGVPVRIAHAIVRNESNYRPRVTGSAGEVGLMQIKVASARGVGFSGSRAQLYDPAINLTYGLRYLRAAAGPYGYSCAGLGRYQRGRFASPVCTGYGRRVMAFARL